MDIQTILIIVAIGAVAGWLAGVIMSGSGFGLLGDIVIGIIGAVIGGFLFGLLGLAAVGLIGQIISATVGAVVLIFVLRLLKKA
ncbi:MAG: GlsB/YeaQ/YmgE family stress response membrane protein [Gammaproteobacteria bacterium]|jgi:uncharacterized membrane protein YeaQ/YmgE (transglycosylase-associated protein family)|nr:GlsB/YeaQ/YmgE family stress response membrane protein [Gammaproteobacteria bacterium]MDH3971692.1 GlsB/YeaQ/YmgE family stress response membrane protein [Gammaproteobacteria bacterium]MDH3985543.1 GlsB/YeaQ/YmgE family stress response membrane protein [Gammaproteobacteria bacterium]